MNESKIFKVAVALAVLVLIALIGLRFATPERVADSPVPVPASTEPLPSSPRRAESNARRTPDPVPVAVDEDSETNALALPQDKVEEYLQRHNRNAASLLAAYHAMQDTNLLNEAAEKFPNDLYVQWAMLTSENLNDPDRRKWLEAFKTSSPDNSLANYLSAAEHFKSGNRDAAIKEITDASGKALFKDYAMESMIDEQELRRASGQSAMLAMHGNGWSGDLLHELSPMKGVANGIFEAQEQFKQSGDSASAANLLQMGLMLSGRLNGGDGNKFVIGELMGNAIEAKMLATLDPNTKYDLLGGKTPVERQAELKESKATFRELATIMPKAYGVLNESEWASYSDRMKTFGEREALKWLKQRVGEAEGK